MTLIGSSRSLEGRLEWSRKFPGEIEKMSDQRARLEKQWETTNAATVESELSSKLVNDNIPLGAIAGRHDTVSASSVLSALADVDLAFAGRSTNLLEKNERLERPLPLPRILLRRIDYSPHQYRFRLRIRNALAFRILSNLIHSSKSSFCNFTAFLFDLYRFLLL